jgi:hypothetical protein
MRLGDADTKIKYEWGVGVGGGLELPDDLV